MTQGSSNGTAEPPPGAASTPDTDVLVVGAGPVGLTLANLLGTHGVRARVVEAGDGLIDYPRGVGMDDECLRTFQAAGVVERVLPHTAPRHIMRFVNGAGRQLAEIAPRTDEFGWSRRNAFVQPLVDAELLAALDRFPHVDVRFSRTLAGYRQDATGVTATLATPDGGEEVVRARYLVGCDGGRSTTRRLTGTSFEGQSSSTRFLVVDVRNDPLGTPNAYLGCDPARPFVSIALPHGIRRFEFMLMPGETEEQAADPRFVADRLAKLVPDPYAMDVIRHRVYTHHARIAGSFRTGRVFLAGDAAHLMPVWQGQGYNSGVRDAVNLAWKLVAVVRGVAADALLDSYDAERRDHALAMIRLSVTVGRFVSPTNRLLTRARDVAASALALVPAVKRYVVEMRFKPMPRFTTGAIVAADLPERLTPVGRLFGQPRVDVRTADGVRPDVLLDDAIGPWFAVLAWGNDPAAILDDDARAVLDRLGARLVSLRPAEQLPAVDAAPGTLVVGDRTGRLKEWFDARPVSVVFLRPDRVVAAACLAQRASDTTRDLATALRLTGGTDAAGPHLPVPQPAARGGRA